MERSRRCRGSEDAAPSRLLRANLLSGRDEWHVYLGVNGRWQAPDKSLHGDSAELKFEVPLDLHPDDPIEIAVCGFEADVVHDSMCHDTGLPAKLIGARNTDVEAREIAERVRNGFLAVLTRRIPNENDTIGMLFATHRSDIRDTFTKQSPKKDYRLRYRIEGR